jgi:hypothetical protein
MQRIPLRFSPRMCPLRPTPVRVLIWAMPLAPIPCGNSNGLATSGACSWVVCTHCGRNNRRVVYCVVVWQCARSRLPPCSAPWTGRVVGYLSMEGRGKQFLWGRSAPLPAHTWVWAPEQTFHDECLFEREGCLVNGLCVAVDL